MFVDILPMVVPFPLAAISLANPSRVPPRALQVDYGRGIDHKFDFVQLGSMTFKAPDEKKYPCIPLAYAAGRQGGTMTCALNAANEMANELFRGGQFDFFGIPKVSRPPRIASPNLPSQR